mmetsp:Transcript_40002/g.103407  ORF Transcript_40002/g.103407 Transcript_40002/m.103407 type:complete len:1225 (-) Transcript_40002:8691-12365(-)
MPKRKSTEEKGLSFIEFLKGLFAKARNVDTTGEELRLYVETQLPRTNLEVLKVSRPNGKGKVWRIGEYRTEHQEELRKLFQTVDRKYVPWTLAHQRIWDDVVLAQPSFFYFKVIFNTLFPDREKGRGETQHNFFMNGSMGMAYAYWYNHMHKSDPRKTALIKAPTEEAPYFYNFYAMLYNRGDVRRFQTEKNPMAVKVNLMNRKGLEGWMTYYDAWYKEHAGSLATIPPTPEVPTEPPAQVRRTEAARTEEAPDETAAEDETAMETETGQGATEAEVLGGLNRDPTDDPVLDLRDEALDAPVLLSAAETSVSINAFLEVTRVRVMDEALLDRMRRKMAALMNDERYRDICLVQADQVLSDIRDSRLDLDRLRYYRITNILPQQYRSPNLEMVMVSDSELSKAKKSAMEKLQNFQRDQTEKILHQQRMGPEGVLVPTKWELRTLGDMLSNPDAFKIPTNLSKGTRYNRKRQWQNFQEVGVFKGNELYIKKITYTGGTTEERRKDGFAQTLLLRVYSADEYLAVLSEVRTNSQHELQLGQEVKFIEKLSRIAYTGSLVNPMTGNPLGFPIEVARAFIKNHLQISNSIKEGKASQAIARIYQRPFQMVQIDLKMVHMRSGSPIEVQDVVMDVQGREVWKDPKVVAYEGIRYFCVMVDCFSKMAWVMPMATKEASQVLFALSFVFEFCGYGFPQAVRMDNGSEFVAAEVKNYLLRNGVVVHYGKVNRPEGQGVVERFNRTLKGYIEARVKQARMNPDFEISNLNFSLQEMGRFMYDYNHKTQHSLFRDCPANVFFGRDKGTWSMAARDINQNSVEEYNRYGELSAPKNYTNFLNPYVEFLRTSKSIQEGTVKAFESRQRKSLRYAASKKELNYFFKGDLVQIATPSDWTNRNVREWSYEKYIVTGVYVSSSRAFLNSYMCRKFKNGVVGDVLRDVSGEMMHRISESDEPPVVAVMRERVARDDGAFPVYQEGMDKWTEEEAQERLQVVTNITRNNLRLMGTLMTSSYSYLPQKKQLYLTKLQSEIKEFIDDWNGGAWLTQAKIKLRGRKVRGQANFATNIQKSLHLLQEVMKMEKELAIEEQKLDEAQQAVVEENTREWRAAEKQRELVMKLNEKYNDIQGQAMETLGNDTLFGALHVDILFDAKKQVDTQSLRAVFALLLKKVKATNAEDTSAYVVLLMYLGKMQRYLEFMDTNLGSAEELGDKESLYQRVIRAKAGIKSVFTKLLN